MERLDGVIEHGQKKKKDSMYCTWSWAVCTALRGLDEVEKKRSEEPAGEERRGISLSLLIRFIRPQGPFAYWLWFFFIIFFFAMFNWKAEKKSRHRRPRYVWQVFAFFFTRSFVRSYVQTTDPGRAVSLLETIVLSAFNSLSLSFTKCYGTTARCCVMLRVHVVSFRYQGRWSAQGRT